MSNCFVTPWTVAHQTPLCMGFSRQEYWCGLPVPSPGDLSDPGIKPASLALQADSILLSHWGSPVYSSVYSLMAFSIFIFLLLSWPSMSRTSSSSQTETPYLLNNNIIHRAYKICFDQLFVLLVRLPVNRRLLVVKRRRQWHPTPVLLPGKSHGWRSLVGCSPWGR